MHWGIPCPECHQTTPRKEDSFRTCPTCRHVATRKAAVARLGVAAAAAAPTEAEYVVEGGTEDSSAATWLVSSLSRWM